MKRGKKICKTLKEVRKQVARANGIAYNPTECHYEGDCAGTCPKCESELRFLEQQLQLRRQLGKAVAVVGVSMGLAALTSCGHKESDRTAGEIEPYDSLSIECQQDGNQNTDSDALSAVKLVADSNVTDQDAVGNTQLSKSQAVEPIEIAGEVQLLPLFPGGYQALLAFLQENIKYPEQAEKDSISGQVMVTFNVETDGSITNPKITKSVHPLLDAEALRVVNLMPKWESDRPGTYNLPVNFQLGQ